jgi:hypothetical protein
MSASYFYYIKVGVFIILAAISGISLSILYKVESQSDCDCAQSWRSKLLVIFSYVILAMSLINLVIPMNSTIAKLPLLGGLYSMCILACLGIQIWLVATVFKDIKNCDTCEITGANDQFISIFTGLSVAVLSVCVIVLAYASIAL